MAVDQERWQAVVDLLSVPDSADLRRTHRRTCEGRPDRHRMLPYLAAAFVQTKLLEQSEREELSAPRA
jgi:hypothetical protein